MKLEPTRSESVVIDPRAAADNGVGDDAWSKEEFEEEEEEEEDEDEEEEGEEEDSEDEEGADEDTEEEDSSEKDEEEEPARPPRKPVHVARTAGPERAQAPAAMSRRQPGANKNAIVAELDENAIARHLLAALDFGSPPPK
jgi:archaellum component FlaD/FlaE